MVKLSVPELKPLMNKKVNCKLNGNRMVQGLVRGYDPFMNLVLADCSQITNGKSVSDMGTVIVRGNSIILLEALENI